MSDLDSCANNPSGLSRRDFLRTVAGAAVAGSLPIELLAQTPATRTASDVVTLGKTPIKMSRLGVGTGTNSGAEVRALGQEAFTKLIHYAYDRGIRYIDTAESYRTHTMIGNAIKGLPREKMTILTKIEVGGNGAVNVAAALDRFRKELQVEMIDILLIHYRTTPTWVADCAKVRDDLAAAKQKGIIRAHGVSCHGLPALSQVSACDWVDVSLARINHQGTLMDSQSTRYTEVPATAEERKIALEEIVKIHKAGKGVIGMKLYGGGAFKTAEEREKSIRFVMNQPYVDAATIGVTTTAQLDEAIERVNRALKPA